MKHNSGFTLIELMITVAIVGILVAVAYPSYIEQARSTRRANAQSDLMELAGFMERLFTENNCYNAGADAICGNGDDAALLPFTESPKEGSGAKFYNLTLVVSATAFTLAATAKNDQLSDSCGNMTLSQSGVRTYTGSATGCW